MEADSASAPPFEEIPDDEKPVYSFLPPTDDISALRLSVAIGLVALLTVSLCCNVSHLVLQVYSRRFRTGFPVQHLISLLFMANALMPLSLPPLILEKLVNLWMFGRLSCLSHHVIKAAVRILVPWLLVLIAHYIGRDIRQRQFHSILIISIFAFLMAFIVIPQGFASEFQYSIVDRGSSTDGAFILRIHVSKCELLLRRTSFWYIELFAEIIVPYVIILWNAFRLARVAREPNGCKRISFLLLASLVYLLCNAMYFFPVDWTFVDDHFHQDDSSYDTKFEDIMALLPYLSPALIWYPINKLSALLANYRVTDIRLVSETRASSYMMNPSSRILRR